MKSTGIVRKLDELGRIVIPKELRTTYGIKEGDPIEIMTTEDGILLKLYRPGCSCCNTVSGLIEINGIRLCADCIQKFANGGAR